MSAICLSHTVTKRRLARGSIGLALDGLTEVSAGCRKGKLLGECTCAIDAGPEDVGGIDTERVPLMAPEDNEGADNCVFGGRGGSRGGDLPVVADAGC